MSIGERQSARMTSQSTKSEPFQHVFVQRVTRRDGNAGCHWSANVRPHVLEKCFHHRHVVEYGVDSTCEDNVGQDELYDLVQISAVGLDLEKHIAKYQVERDVHQVLAAGVVSREDSP